MGRSEPLRPCGVLKNNKALLAAAYIKDNSKSLVGNDTAPCHLTEKAATLVLMAPFAIFICWEQHATHDALFRI